MQPTCASVSIIIFSLVSRNGIRFLKNLTVYNIFLFFKFYFLSKVLRSNIIDFQEKKRRMLQILKQQALYFNAATLTKKSVPPFFHSFYRLSQSKSQLRKLHTNITLHTEREKENDQEQ